MRPGAHPWRMKFGVGIGVAVAIGFSSGKFDSDFRQRPRQRCRLRWIGLCFTVPAGITVLDAAHRLGVGIENICGGLGTAAFVALVMSLCDHRFTATQFALLSSLEALGRVFSGRPSAEVVALVGWPQFFFLSFLLALPGVDRVVGSM